MKKGDTEKYKIKIIKEYLPNSLIKCIWNLEKTDTFLAKLTPKRNIWIVQLIKIKESSD